MVVENLKMYSVGAPLFIVLLWTVQSGLALDLHCLTETGSPGTCVFSGMCDSSSENSHKCGTVHNRELICCPVSNHKSPLLPEPPQCGLQREDNVYSEQSTTIFEFPWLVRIFYEKSIFRFNFACIGSLINDRYVLTAADCVVTPWKVHRVRLGEWDWGEDCMGDVCSNAPIDVGIEQIVVHNNFDPSDETQANNIALVRLNQTVSFSLSVQPICLPLPSTRDDLNRNDLPTYQGGWRYWGVKIKFKVSNGTNWCGNSLPRKTPLNFCVVNPNDAAFEYKISYGGPLMRKLNGPWYQIGVDSVADRGKFMQYANVTAYIDWIKDNVY